MEQVERLAAAADAAANLWEHWDAEKLNEFKFTPGEAPYKAVRTRVYKMGKAFGN